MGTSELEQAAVRRMAICLDFDGVLKRASSEAPVSSQTLSWLQGILHDERFQIYVHSVRGGEPGGVRYMQEWFRKLGLSATELGRITYSAKKPPAAVYIDDRAFRFEGVYPSPDTLVGFVTWEERTHVTHDGVLAVPLADN